MTIQDILEGQGLRKPEQITLIFQRNRYREALQALLRYPLLEDEQRLLIEEVIGVQDYETGGLPTR